MLEYLDGVHGSVAEHVMRPILWIVTEQFIQGVQVGAAGHCLAMKSKIICQFIDEEERSLIAITT